MHTERTAHMPAMIPATLTTLHPIEGTSQQPHTVRYPKTGFYDSVGKKVLTM